MKRVGLGILAFCAIGFAQDNLTFWNKYKTIHINTKASGAGVSTTVKNFPVLVRLNAANANDIFTEALANGGDIRFGNTAGQPRPYQIESWDNVGKTAAIWVLVDSVKGNDSIAALRIYWGRSGQTTTSNGAAVFDTAHDWRVVYHMNGGTSATELDATIHGLHLSASDTVTAAVPGDTVGAVGKARTFAGNAATIEGRQFFVALNSASNPAVDWSTSSPHTISAWVFARSISAANNHGNSVFNKGDQQYAMQIYGASGANAKLWESAIYTSTWRQAKSKGVATTGAWFHIVGTWSGAPDSTANLYVNGVLDTTLPLGLGTPNPTRGYNLFVGANPSAGGNNEGAPGTTRGLARMTSNTTRPRYWDGYLDEITLSRGVRSAAFVRLAYETQKPGAAALTFATAVTQPPVSIPLAKFGYADTNKNADTLVYLAGAAVNVTPMLRGGPVDSFKVVGTQLPAGLTVNKTSGVLSGSAAATAAANYTVRAWGHGGNAGAVDSISRTVRLTIQSTASLSYHKDTVTYLVNVPAVPNVATFVGGTPTYTVSPALPAGLSLNASTGLISGVPTAASAAANYTVKAKTAMDSAVKVVNITVVSGAGENYATGWSMHKELFLNTTATGVTITAGVGKFPVLVRITDSLLGSGTLPQASGADFRFTKADNSTRLPHEIESWNAATKTGAIWVLVDTIIANSNAQKFVMHWGNATAPNLSSGPSVFDTANGFQAVWHLNGSANELDATANGFLAVAANAPTSGAGVVGTARTLNGTNQYFSVPNSASGRLNFKQYQSYTLSSWINATAISNSTSGTGHKIIDKGDNQYVLATYGNSIDARYWEITVKANNTWNQCIANGQAPNSTKAVLASSSVGSWNHLVGTLTGGATEITQRLYYNGELVSTCTINNTDTTGRTETHNVHLGVQVNNNGFERYFNGALDEPRLSNKARSADWVKLEYENQKAGQKLVTTQGSSNVRAAASMAGAGLQVKPAANGLVFQVNGLGNDEKAELSLVDVWGRTVFSSPVNGRLNWNGNANNGQGVSSGVYLARVKIVSAEGRTTRVYEQRVPFTR